MSTTTSPVTQIAEVAVKNASMNDAPPGPDLAIGSISRTVPTARAVANAPMISCAVRAAVTSRGSVLRRCPGRRPWGERIPCRRVSRRTRARSRASSRAWATTYTRGCPPRTGSGGILSRVEANAAAAAPSGRSGHQEESP